MRTAGNRWSKNRPGRSSPATFSAHGLQAHPKGLERLGRHALTLVDEAQQDVLSADEIMVEQSRLFLGQDQDPSGSVSETFEHALPPAPTLPAAPLFRRSAMRNGSLRGRRCDDRHSGSTGSRVRTRSVLIY